MIIDAWEPIIGGGQVHVQNICRKLIENHNCEIDLFVRALVSDDDVAYDKNEFFYDWKLQIIRCGRPKKFFNLIERILSIFSITRQVIKSDNIRKYDIIHAHSFLWLFSWKIAAFILWLPIVWTVHWANLLDRWTWWIYYFIEKFLLTKLRYNTLITVWSSFLKHKNRNKNIVVIWNGVNREEYDSVQTEKNPSIFKILFVWRFEWTKWVDTLLEAIHLLDRRLLDTSRVEFHLIGYWYDEEIYRKMSEGLKLDRYVFFRWKIFGKELISEYKSSDLFILPSRTEWFWMTIIEAMVSKTLVIVTRCWWPEDIIEDGKNWFLVEKENPEELARKIQECIENRIANKEQLIECAYDTAKNNYSWDGIVKKTYEVYQGHTK